MPLRKYQQECVDLIDNLDPGRYLVAVATGLGKTMIATHIKRKGRVLFLSHRDELVHQPERYYDCSFGMEKAELESHGEDVVSASVQTLSRDHRLQKFKPDEFYTIIIDEAHHAAAVTYKKILDYFSGAKIILGLTATPKRGDGVRLDDVFDKIIFSKDLKWGIENHYLCNLRCARVSANYSLTNVKKTAGDYNLKDLEKEIVNRETLAKAAKTYVGACHEKNRHTLIYCVTKKACEELRQVIHSMLPDKEKKSVCVLTGDTNHDDRRQIIKGFQDGSVKCIINCMVLTEGTDLPICDTIINLRPTCNDSLYQQMAGRGTRLYEGKGYCLLIDIVPDGDQRRNLCTAPSLFGIDAEALTKRQQQKLNENENLLDFCNELKDIVSDVASQMSLKIEIIDAFINERKELIKIEGGNGLPALAKKYTSFCDEGMEQECDFGDLFVEKTPDDERAYALHPTYDNVIYFSKPDVLGVTTVRFEVDTQYAGFAIGTKPMIKPCYVSKMKINDAIKLATNYCLLMPERYQYSWSKKAQDLWKELPCTARQKDSLKKEYKKFSIDCSNADRLSKLEASRLIGLVKSIQKKEKERKKYISEKRKSRKNAESAFEMELNFIKDNEKLGASYFPEFERRVQKRTELRLKREKDEQDSLQRILNLGCITICAQIYTSLNRPASSKQISYIDSLRNKCDSNNVVIPTMAFHKSINNKEASAIISLLNALLEIHKKREEKIYVDAKSVTEMLNQIKNKKLGTFTYQVKIGSKSF